MKDSTDSRPCKRHYYVSTVVVEVMDVITHVKTARVCSRCHACHPKDRDAAIRYYREAEAAGFKVHAAALVTRGDEPDNAPAKLPARRREMKLVRWLLSHLANSN